MKHRMIKILVAGFFIMIFGIRVYCVNSQTRYPINKNYAKDEEVEIENNFFDNNREKMNGYSVSVVNTELITIEGFCKKYNVEKQGGLLCSDYVYLVTVNFKNNNSTVENAGIDLGQYMIVNKAYMNYCDREAYKYVNDFKSLIFSLREGTNKDFVIPFTINKSHISEEEFKKGNPQLIISLYPARKAISLK